MPRNTFDDEPSTLVRVMAWHRQATSQCLNQELRWRHNELDGVSDHQPHDCLLNRLFGRRSKKTSKLCVTGLCAGNSPGTGEFPAQMASNAEKVSIWWRHHGWRGSMSPYDITRSQWVETPFQSTVWGTICDIHGFTSRISSSEFDYCGLWTH